MGDEYTNLALLTDGLRAEREQGITIDVAYRYFATPKRKFIIADTPGHIQYTRNMVTGASTADLALDPRRRPQRRRRAVPPPRLPRVAAAASRTSCCASTRWTSSTTTRSASRRSRTSSASFAMKLDVADLTFIPISALHGDNVVDRSRQHALVRGRVAAAPPRGGAHRVATATSSTPGSRCSTCIRPHERRATTTTAATPARSPAACSSRATRSWCCRRASRSTIAAIDTSDGPVDEAFPPMSVTVTLDRRHRRLAAAT